MKESNGILLGVNIDHVATLREGRKESYPEPIKAALYAEEAGADSITVHLREDRRHIQERDIFLLKELLQIGINLEIAPTKEMILFAKELKPSSVCIVPESRQEITTEGGFDIVNQELQIKNIVSDLKDCIANISVFVDPDETQIRAASRIGVRSIEINTGRYSNAKNEIDLIRQLKMIISSIKSSLGLGLTVNAGHGLNYHNVKNIAAIKGLNELNIGHSLVAHALFVGFKSAVSEMKFLIKNPY